VEAAPRRSARSFALSIAQVALKYIHFQNQEALCRHLFNSVDAMVQAYKTELQDAGVKP
jgi:hypothetical protein